MEDKSMREEKPVMGKGALEGKGEQQKQRNPKLEKEINAYVSGLSNMIHSKDTRNQVYEILKSGPPEKVIPQASLLINDRMETAVTEKGKKPSLEVLLHAGAFLVSEMIEIGEAGGFFELAEEEVGPILQDTLQQYIEGGLKSGKIDPVELQQAVEPLMNDKQKAIGLEAGAATGVPQQAGQEAAMEQYATQRVRQRESQLTQNMGSQMRQQQQQAQPQQPQGGQ